ncbi:PAS domain S-box protein [Archangium violaceum]|uniref:PAS domain-containing sensor histidine kinase n=1 Tax=Archangium violaceum TaxID=83451 RepID=UPI00193BB8D1|nr:PAS domain-containing sensor histidine kinase [Archangium violaceum]QRK08990.1 PAS domain S-box protein [Archangium violaceum]
MNILRSFQGKLLLFFLLIDVALVGFLIATVSSGAREALETASREHLRELARFASHDIDEQLQLRWALAQSLASNPFMTHGVINALGRGDPLAPLMRRLSLPGQQGRDADLWLLDARGNVIARNGPGPSVGSFADAPWWSKLRGGVPQAWVVSEEGLSRVFFAFPLLSPQDAEGVLVAGFDLSFVRGGAARQGLEVVLLDDDKPLAGTLPEQVIGELRSLDSKPGQRNTALIDGMFYLLVPVEGFAREHGFGWSLVLSVPAERISGPVEALRQRVSQVGAGAVVLVALLVAWRTRLLLRPLHQLRVSMRRIIDGGDLGERVQVQSRDELGAIAGTFNLMLERLAHRTAELERSRDHLSLLAQITSSSPNAIVMLGREGWTLVWNEAAERLFGWPRLEMLGVSFLERVVPGDARERFSALLARADEGNPVEAELSLLTWQSGTIPVQLTVSRILDAVGQVQGHVCIARDLREVKRLRESLVHSEKMAAVGTLVAGLSHELNNPLGIILGFAQGLLRRPSLDDASRKGLLTIESQTQRCARLVRTLLDFSRKSGPARERVDVASMLERVLELASGQARRGQVRLEIVELPNGLPGVEANVPEMESALLNLVGNALDATPPGGTVSVGARVTPARDGVELFVADTGSGIPPDVLQRIFDPFFTTKPVGQGTGLGLSITRSIIESHGGRIDVETAAGAGTTMRLWFPVAPVLPKEASV